MKRRRRGALRRAGTGLDLRTFAEGMRFPGIDPRQWISYGTVEGQTKDDEDPEVVFDPDYGPLVKVMLQPSMIPVVCRVGSQTAGNGEGEYFPFVAGDEVLVAIPEGDEIADCVILCRMNNAIDKFPMESVAGQDPTTNAFAFKRTRTAYVQEAAGPYLIRSATTGAAIGIDDKGGATVLNGDSSGLQISSDVIGFSTKDGSAMLQLDLTGHHIVLRMDDALLTLASSSGTPEESMLTVPGSLAINTGGNPANEHVCTTEAVVNIVANMIMALGVVIGTTGAVPITGTAFATATAIPLAYTAYAAGITAACTGPTSVLPAPVLAAILAGFATQGTKPIGFPTGQSEPGLGCSSLFAG